MQKWCVELLQNINLHQETGTHWAAGRILKTHHGKGNNGSTWSVSHNETGRGRTSPPPSPPSITDSRQRSWMPGQGTFSGLNRLVTEENQGASCWWRRTMLMVTIMVTWDWTVVSYVLWCWLGWVEIRHMERLFFSFFFGGREVFKRRNGLKVMESAKKREPTGKVNQQRGGQIG